MAIHENETEDEQDGRDRYDAVVRTVEMNTGGRQRPFVSRDAVATIRSGAGDDTDDTDWALLKAVQEGDLVRWTEDGAYVFCRATPWSVRQAIGYVQTHGRDRKNLIENLVGIVAKLEARDGGL